jgi:hypothetical protein
LRGRAVQAQRWLAYVFDQMLEIRYSNQDGIEISGSAALLNEIAQSIYQLLESVDDSIVFEAHRSFDPSPYDRVLSLLHILKGNQPAKALLINEVEVVVEGSVESLRAFASLFEFETNAAAGDHSHFEYEDYEGNRFVSRGSMPMVISVR